MLDLLLPAFGLCFINGDNTKLNVVCTNENIT